MRKYEWRKSEQDIYLPKNKPEIISVPEFQFVTISGEGNPNSAHFSEYIGVLYAVSYAIKMGLKKMETPPKTYKDYTVYPLEGEWDLKEEARLRFDGTIHKDDLVFQLMIRQPNFVSDSFFNEMFEIVKKKRLHNLLNDIKFLRMKEGKCIQMLHIGSYDNEPVSFQRMEAYAADKGLTRISKVHREIYLSNFRKTQKEKLKTVLRFKVE